MLLNCDIVVNSNLSFQTLVLIKTWNTNTCSLLHLNLIRVFIRIQHIFSSSSSSFHLLFPFIFTDFHQLEISRKWVRQVQSPFIDGYDNGEWSDCGDCLNPASHQEYLIKLTITFIECIHHNPKNVWRSALQGQFIHIENNGRPGKSSKLKILMEMQNEIVNYDKGQRDRAIKF